MGASTSWNPLGLSRPGQGLLYLSFMKHYTRVIQKLKLKNGWEREGNNCCEGGNAVVSSILQFLFVFAFKEISGRPEVSLRRRGEKQSHYMVVQAVEFYDSVMETHTQTKKYVDKDSDCIEK
jgi:hypothetical protein